jgi:hypothetical protein
MIKNGLNLLKARKDPEKARELAAQMVKDEVQNQTDGVIFKVKLAYYALLSIPIGFTVLGLYLGLKFHGIFYLISLIAAGILFGIIKARKVAAAQLQNARRAAKSHAATYKVEQIPDLTKAEAKTEPGPSQERSQTDL